jgi:hypothetical protein
VVSIISDAYEIYHDLAVRVRSKCCLRLGSDEEQGYW